MLVCRASWLRCEGRHGLHAGEELFGGPKMEVEPDKASWISMALVTLGGLYSLLRFTRAGLVIRATMERPQMAAAVGIGPDTVYMGTFVLGAALTGLAGGLLAPISGMAPTMGGDYIARAFITVLGGGASIVTGSALASTVFGFIDQVATFLTTPVFGEVALLLFALILIRLLPQGITGRFFRRGL